MTLWEMLLLLYRQTGKEKQNFFFSDLPAKENFASVHNALPPENVACCTSLQSPPFPLPARVTKRTYHIIMTVLNLESPPSMQGLLKSMTVSGFPSWQKKCLTGLDPDLSLSYLDPKHATKLW